VARQIRERLRPVRHNFVRTGHHVEAAFVSGDGTEADVRRLTLNRLHCSTEDETADQRCGNARDENSRLTHMATPKFQTAQYASSIPLTVKCLLG
jgi:hypothetical protein